MSTLVWAGNARLRSDAAADYQRALNDGAPDLVTSSYRDWSRQMELYKGWLAKKPGYNFALHPDKSDHCKGIAIDVYGVAKAWWRANGAKYGFHFTDKTEDWHIAYRPTWAGYVPGTNNTPPVEVPKKEIERMSAVIQRYGRPEQYLLDGGNLVWLRASSEVNDCLRVCNQEKVIIIGENTFQRINEGIHSRAQLAADKVIASLKKVGAIK